MSDTNERSVASTGSVGEREIVCGRCDGTNIRDTFAAAALTGLLVLNKPGYGQQVPDEVIRRAWLWADATLRQRNTPQPQTTPDKCSVRNGCTSGRETVPDTASRVWETHPPVCHVPLQKNLTLTDAEREVFAAAPDWLHCGISESEAITLTETLRGLLERLK